MYRYAAPALVALLFSTTAAAQEQQAPYDLIYNPSTGSLTIDTHGGDLYSYAITINTEITEDVAFGEGDQNNQELPAPPAFIGFNLDNYIPLPNNHPAVNPAPDVLPGLNLAGWIALPPTSLGNVLPPGLTQAQLDGIIDDAVYMPVLGGGGSGPLPQFNVTAIPEPTSLALLAAAGLLFARRRRPA